MLSAEQPIAALEQLKLSAAPPRQAQTPATATLTYATRAAGFEARALTSLLCLS